MNPSLRTFARFLFAAATAVAQPGGGTATAAPQPADEPSAGAQPEITTADLLRRIIDLNRLATPPPAGERTRMFSSYDRASKIDERGEYVAWDANGDAGQFMGRDDDGWDIMADVSGPGAITRIWSANPHGRIRFILDGGTVLETDFGQLLAGRMPPFEEPLVYRGLNSYMPMGFATSCRVACRESSAYYQINVVQFAPGTRVQRFDPALDEAAQAALAEVKAALEQGLTRRQLFGDARTMPVAVEQDVGPDEKLVQALDGAGTVRALHLAVTNRDPVEPYALHRCILRVYADGERSPSVEAPLVDFFGSGFERVPLRSLVAGTDLELDVPLPDRRAGEGRYFYCYFPMPYRAGLRVEIENLNEAKRPIALLLYLEVDRRPPPDDALRFYARFRKEDPCRVLDYPILETTGRGRIVGCVLNVDCPRAGWWGEGDDKVWIDGERFPSYFGTGSEDYLGDAWGLHPHIRPLQGVTRCANYGKASAYRWHIADCINFRKSVRFTIENWQFGGFKDTYYSTVVYWYGDPGVAGAKGLFKPLELVDVTPPGLRIPGAIEVEGRIAGEGWGNIVKEKFAGGAEFSDRHAANITTAEPVSVTLPAPADEVVRLRLRTNPRRTFETIRVKDATGRTIGTVAWNRDAVDGIYDVGLVRLAKGDNALTVECSQPAMLDCWVLEPLPRNPRGPEGEDLVAQAGMGVTATPEYATFDWSGGGQLRLDFAHADATATLPLPERKEAGAATLRLHITAEPEGGRFEVSVNGRPLGQPIDAYAEQRVLKRVSVANVALEAGENRLELRALEPNPAARGRRLGLDAVELPRAISANALECEDLTVLASAGTNHEVQGIGGASGDEHLWCRPTGAGGWVELEAPLRAAGRYKLAAILTRSFDYGLVQVCVNGEKAGGPVDTYDAKIVPGLRVELGTFDLPAGPLRLRFEVVGKSDASSGYYFGVDAVMIEPS